MTIRRQTGNCAEECSSKKSVLKTTLQILGVGIIIGTAIGISTKRVFDEIFVDDDWSDDWDEYEDNGIEEYYVID